MPSNQTNINIGVKYNVDQSSVNAVKKSLQDLQNIKPANFSGTKNQLDDIKKTAKQVQSALDAAFNVNLNSLNIQTFNQQLRTAGLSVDRIYQKFSSAGAQGQVAFSKMASSVLTTNLQLKQTKSLITSMGETMTNTIKWGIASSVMNNFTNSVRQAFQYAQSLDGALTDIRIVTGDSTEQMRQFAKQANNAAQNLGRSTMDYTKAALSFYQQGLSDEEVQTRTQTVLKAQNITGAGQEMADYLTAVWNGYKVANQEAELYVDKLAAVADSSASNMSQLAVAMSKVASSANALGVPVDNLNAQIATIVATTRQAPESVGNALKTIYSRINDIATGADDAQVSLGNYSSKMLDVGISVLDANGNLRDTGDVIDEIGGKWQTLSREQQIYLARTMAGQRQYNNLIALFDNWGKYTDLVNVSMDAQGTTMQKNARYMDSLEAKMEQFGAAGQRIKDAIINEEDLKGLVDFGTNIVSLFGSLIESIGGGKSAIISFGTVFAQIFSGTITKEINNAITNFQNFKNNEVLKQADIENTKLYGASKGYKDDTISAMVNAKKAAQDYYDFMQPAQINEYNQYVKNIGQIKQKILVLEEEKRGYQSLFKIIQRRKNLSEEDTSEYMDSITAAIERQQSVIKATQKTLVNYSGSIKKDFGRDTVNAIENSMKKVRASMTAEGFQKQGGKALLEKAEQIKALGQSSQYSITKIKTLASEYQNWLDKAKEKVTVGENINQINAEIQRLQNEMRMASQEADRFLNGVKQYASVKTFVNITVGLSQAISGLSNIINLTKVWRDQNTSTGQKIKQTFTSIGFSLPLILNGLSSVTKNYKGFIAAIKLSTLARQIDVNALKEQIIQQKIQAGMSYQQAAATATKTISQKAHAVTLHEVALAYKDVVLSAMPYIALAAGVALAIYGLYKAWNQEKQAAQKAAKAAQEAKQKYDDIKTSFNELKSSIENYHNAQDAIKDLTKGTQEWRDAIKESNDQVLQLLDKYPQLAAYVSSVNGQLQISDKGFDTLIESQTKALRQAQAESIKASDESRQADLKKMAADIGHESMYTMPTSDGGMSMAFANSQQVLAVAQALSNLEDFSAGEGALAEQIAKQTNLSIEVVNAILQHKDSLISLGTQIDNNTQASKLMYEQVAKENLGENEQYQGLSDEQQSITEALVAKKLAEAESAQETKAVLDNLNESVREATELFNKLQGALPSNNREAMEKFLTGQGLNGLSKQQLQNLNPYDQQTRKFFDENYQQFKDENGQQYKDGYAFQQAFIAAQKQSLAEYEQAVKGTTGSVKEYFKELNNSAISVDYAKNTIQKDLEDALTKGGQEGVANLANFYNKVKDTSKLDEVAQSFDFTKGTAQELDQALRKAGAATNLTTKELEAYIAVRKQEGDLTAEQIYNNVHDVIDKKNGKTLKYNDEISDQAYQGLVQAGVEVEGAFVQMTNGAWKFVGDAEEFYKQANQASLSPFLDKINQLKNQLELLKNTNLSYQDLNQSQYTYLGHGEKTVNYDLVQQQVNALGASGLISEEDIAKYNDLISLRQMDKDTLEQIAGLIRKNEDNLDGFLEKQKEVTQEQLHQKELQVAFSQQDLGQLRDLRNSEDQPLDLLTDEQYIQALIATADAEGLVKENVQALAEQLASSADQLQHTNDDLKDHRKECYEVAAAAQDLVVGIEGIQKAWKETTKEQVEAAGSGNKVLAQTTALISDMFNQDVGEDFVTAHLAQIERIAQGDLAAVQDLGVALGLLRINDVKITTQLDTTTFDAEVADLQDKIQGQDWGQIQFGATIDGADFYNALQKFIIESGATQEQINKILAGIGYDPDVDYRTVTLHKGADSGNGTEYYVEGTLADGTQYRQVVSESFANQYEDGATITVPIIKGSKFVGGAGNLGRIGGSRTIPKAPKSSGGKKGGGGKGKGSTPKAATKAKINTTKIDTNQKEADHNPYQQEQKSFQRQQKLLDNLQDKQKKLVNKDRLKNLQQQNKTLEEQKKILQKELAISANAAAENSTANYANRLRQQFGKALKFDSDGQISDINALNARNAAMYNAAAKSAADAFEKEKAAYNDYIQNTWNKYSTQDQQNANKAEKERWDDRIKAAETAAKDQIKAAEDEYKTRNDLINQYNKAWEEDQKRAEQIQKITDEIYEKRIEMSKIKVDLSIDTGDFERDWLDFENKVIKKLNDDDVLGNAKANAKELMSYFNSDQVKQTANQIKSIQEQIAIMEKGGTSNIYGSNLAQAKEDLEKYMKQQMDDLGNVQELIDNIKENYLDGLDDAKEKMDDQIDQYERVNDLIDHNVKLVQMLYGDKAYDTMNKYYDMQKANNEDALNSLRMQQQYWINLMANQTEGSEAWKAMKKNLDDITDHLNDKLEEMIQNLSDQWANKVDGIIARLNNGLTGGRGLDYLDEQWDFINDYDDNFLDTFESKMGIDEVTNLYQQAIDGLSGSPANQQKINKLMNDQLKILREKDHLTEYDIERAKAALEVQKARMALEDARYNKTKMRLRRDSQGNYTYQYVADEQKLSDLQSALADAQANLYNTDKEHYKENLNKLYDTYKDYIDKMRELTEEYNSTQDETERKRIEERMNLLRDSTNKLMNGLLEDNKYALQYLNESFFGGMGIDTSLLSAVQQQKIMNQNIPQMSSNIQDLANTLTGQGGILNATAAAMAEIGNATVEYDANVKQFLEDAGSSLEIVRDVTDETGNALDQNIVQAQNLITQNQKLIDSCLAEVEALQELLDYMDQYLNKIMNITQLIENLRNAYNTNQVLNGSTLTADNIAVTGNNIDTTIGMEYSGNPATDA